MFFFQNSFFFFPGYVDPVKLFFDNKIIVFWGDLGNISAITATLIGGSTAAVRIQFEAPALMP